jgi:hypothetical protein
MCVYIVFIKVRNEWKKGNKRGEGRVFSWNSKAYMRKWVDLTLETLYVVMRILPHSMEVCCVIGVYSLVFGALQDWYLSPTKSLYKITGRELFLEIPKRASTSAASDADFGRFYEASVVVEGQISEPLY